MGRITKVTISLPEELVSFADSVARERKISRSKVFSMCLREAAEKHRAAYMAEGYKAMARELSRFAVDAAKIANEVLPEWNE